MGGDMDMVSVSVECESESLSPSRPSVRPPACVGNLFVRVFERDPPTNPQPTTNILQLKLPRASNATPPFYCSGVFVSSFVPV